MRDGQGRYGNGLHPLEEKKGRPKHSWKMDVEDAMNAKGLTTEQDCLDPVSYTHLAGAVHSRDVPTIYTDKSCIREPHRHPLF